MRRAYPPCHCLPHGKNKAFSGDEYASRSDIGLFYFLGLLSF
jgi:hypothetical protein